MQGLGQLEAVVMDILWHADGPRRVRQVREALEPERMLAYTTVMTVLDNLHRKGWVVRERDRNAYLYIPARSREEAAALELRQVLASVSNPEAVLLHFALSASEAELAALREGLGKRGRPR